jgi:hypothetical protein
MRYLVRTMLIPGWLAAALLSMSLISGVDTLPRQAQADPRPERLKAFFDAYGCPGPLHVEEYLRAADTYAIDYRLLPALSLVESTCGRYERMNNRWGWDSARTGFRSVPHGIHFLARQLANGKYYRGKTLDEKLRTYNPNPVYPREIRRLMREIEAGPAFIPMASGPG